MEKEQDNRTGEYQQSNDKSTYMTELEKCMDFLEENGYTDQFKVEKKKLLSVTTNTKYKPADVKAVNFYRFEGESDPNDTSILYAIETCDGRKGTLIDAYGLYSDDDTGEFIKEIDVNKKTNKWFNG
jgi:hypothetical protein